MAVTFMGSRMYNRSAEGGSGTFYGFSGSTYYPYNSSEIDSTGYMLYQKNLYYVVGYSATPYVTQLIFKTDVPIKSFSLDITAGPTENTSSTYKHKMVVTTDSTCGTLSASNFAALSGSDIRWSSGAYTTITVTCSNLTIPAGTFYVYLGPNSNNISANKYSLIFAKPSTSSYNKFSFSAVNAPTYTISYNKNGGSGSTPSQTVVQGETTQLRSNGFTAPSTRLYTVTLNGNGGNNGTPTYGSPANKFYRWIKDSASGTTYYSAGADFKPEANTTFYAQWYTPTTMGTTTRSDGEADGYTVNFNANGGSCSTTSLVAKDRVEYEFSSWNSKSDGTGSSLNSTSTYIITYSRTLYAQWTSNQIKGSGSVKLPTATNKSTSTLTVTFQYQGGTGSSSSATYEKTVTKTFKGWGTTSSATSGTTGNYTPTKDDTTLYAVWGSASTSYDTISLPTPTKTGYTFMGWATSESASSGSIGSFSPTTDVTVLYAIWEPDGNVRIYVDGIYKMALAYIYAPSNSSDTKPWKLTLVYLKNPSSSSDTKPWKLVAG